MGRKASEKTLPAAPEVHEEVLRSDLQAFDSLSVARNDQGALVRAVALQVGYQLPGDCIDADLIQRDISMNMRRSVEACLEVGRGLAVLKAACDHGQFVSRLDVIGLDRTVAVRFMQAATKFSNVATSHHLTNAIGTQSKLLEMLVLDDEQISELELYGQTGELKLDEIATMSVKELRKAVREAKAQVEAQQRLLSDKNEKIDELTTVRAAISPTDEKVGVFKAEIAAGFDVLETTISQMHLVHQAILKEDVKWGDSDEAEQLILRQFATLFGDCLNRSAQQLAELCDTYDATLAGWAAELDGRVLTPLTDASGKEA